MTYLLRDNGKLLSFIVFSVTKQPNIACFIVLMLPPVDLKEDYNKNILVISGLIFLCKISNIKIHKFRIILKYTSH